VADKDLKIEEIEGGVVFTVKVVPGSSRTCIAGNLGGMLKIKLASVPEKGKANKCLVDFLAETLGVRKNDVRIISGLTNPVKRVQISGVTAEQLISRLEEYNKP
jgi:uncharacterized protein (TIGR00251 family)